MPVIINLVNKRNLKAEKDFLDGFEAQETKELTDGLQVKIYVRT